MCAAVAVKGDGELGGFGYCNRQRLPMVAPVVDSTDEEVGGACRRGCAANHAGGFVQIQAIGQLAV